MGDPPRGYSLIEHTGDLGIRLEAPTLEELFVTAGRALFEILAEGEVRAEPAASVRLEAPDRDSLLVEWLGELLYLHVPGGWILGRFDVSLGGETSLRAEVGGERFDPARHRIRLEVKAATFHGLHLVCEGGLWRCQVIFDL